MESPCLDPHFEENLLKLQLHRELTINPGLPRVFLDRGLLDVLAYYQFLNRDQSRLMRSVIQWMKLEKIYEKIFLIEHQGVMKTTSIRIENIEQALYLENLQEKNYRQLGFIKITQICPALLKSTQ